MINKIMRLLVLFFCIPIQAINYPCKALVVNPIIDLVGLPIQLYGLNSDVNAAYKDIPISWGPDVKDQPRCPREHQLLFNEVVAIVGEEDQEYHVEISHALLLLPPIQNQRLSIGHSRKTSFLLTNWQSLTLISLQSLNQLISEMVLSKTPTTVWSL